LPIDIKSKTRFSRWMDNYDRNQRQIYRFFREYPLTNIKAVLGISEDEDIAPIDILEKLDDGVNYITETESYNLDMLFGEPHIHPKMMRQYIELLGINKRDTADITEEDVLDALRSKYNEEVQRGSKEPFNKEWLDDWTRNRVYIYRLVKKDRRLFEEFLGIDTDNKKGDSNAKRPTVVDIIDALEAQYKKWQARANSEMPFEDWVSKMLEMAKFTKKRLKDNPTIHLGLRDALNQFIITRADVHGHTLDKGFDFIR